MPETKTATDDAVTSLRRDLVKAAMHWSGVSENCYEVHEHHDGGAGIKETGDAAMMASSYAYVLAAVLKVASQELADDAAPLLASEARMLLDNGDFENSNADVMPGGHKCRFPLQPPEGTFWAPGPCRICGKTWDRAQAEQALAEAQAAMTATEKAGA